MGRKGKNKRTKEALVVNVPHVTDCERTTKDQSDPEIVTEEAADEESEAVPEKAGETHRAHATEETESLPAKEHNVSQNSKEVGQEQNANGADENAPESPGREVRIKEDGKPSLRQETLRKELMEIPLSEKSSTRAVIGAGGVCTSIMMPDETRTVLLKNVPKNWTKADVEKELERFGEVTDISYVRSPVKTGQNRGKVTFSHEECVKQVMQEYDGDLVLVPDGIRKGCLSCVNLRAKIQWCRRPIRGYAFVTPRHSSGAQLMSGRSKVINDSTVTIRYDRKTRNRLFVDELSPDTSVSDVRNAFGEHIAVEDVVIPREVVGETTPDRLKVLRERLKRRILGFADNKEFDVTILPPKPSQSHYIGFINFSNPEQGLAAVRRLNGLSFDGQKLSACPQLRTSFHVPMDIFTAVRNRVETAIQQLKEEYRYSNIKPKERKSGNFDIYVETYEVESMTNIRSILQEIVSGKRVKCATKKQEQALFSSEGKHFLAGLEEDCNVLVKFDARLKTISVYGDPTDIAKVQAEVKDFLGKSLNTKQKEINLKEGRPPGFTKYLLDQYGSDLEALILDAGVETLELEPEQQQLVATGSFEALQKLSELIEATMDNLEENLTETETIHCTGCLSPTKKSMYRLEYCGHPYCSKCIKNLIKSGIKSKQFPITCTDGECQQPLVWKDFNALLGPKQHQTLVKASIERFISENSETYRVCSSSDCSEVHKNGYNDGRPYHCPGCGVPRI